MKLTFFVVLLSLVTTFSNAQEVVWHTDVTKAVAESNKSKKPILLFFTGSDWCGWCIKLQKEVLTQPEFNKWAKDNVVLLELDFPRKSQQSDDVKNQNFQIQQAFGVRGYPTVWFATAQNNNGKVDFNPIGSTGYVAGGATKWIESAKVALAKK